MRVDESLERGLEVVQANNGISGHVWWCVWGGAVAPFGA